MDFWRTTEVGSMNFKTPEEVGGSFFFVRSSENFQDTPQFGQKWSSIYVELSATR